MHIAVLSQGLLSMIVGSYLTPVLHTARISNVEITLYGERMTDGKQQIADPSSRHDPCQK